MQKNSFVRVSLPTLATSLFRCSLLLVLPMTADLAPQLPFFSDPSTDDPFRLPMRAGWPSWTSGFLLKSSPFVNCALLILALLRPAKLGLLGDFNNILGWPACSEGAITAPKISLKSFPALLGPPFCASLKCSSVHSHSEQCLIVALDGEYTELGVQSHCHAKEMSFFFFFAHLFPPQIHQILGQLFAILSPINFRKCQKIGRRNLLYFCSGLWQKSRNLVSNGKQLMCERASVVRHRLILSLIGRAWPITERGRTGFKSKWLLTLICMSSLWRWLSLWEFFYSFCETSLFYSFAHTDAPDGVKNWVRKVAQNNESWNFCERMW